MPDISGSWMSGMLARLILVTMRVVDFGFEVFFTFTFGLRSFIFGRSTALGGTNVFSSFFTTVKTTSIPASRKRPTWIAMLSSTALGMPLVIFCFLDCRFIPFPYLPIQKSLSYRLKLGRHSPRPPPGASIKKGGSLRPP